MKNNSEHPVELILLPSPEVENAMVPDQSSLSKNNVTDEALNEDLRRKLADKEHQIFSDHAARLAVLNLLEDAAAANRHAKNELNERRRAEDALRHSQGWLAGQNKALKAAIDGAPLELSLGLLVRTTLEQTNTDVRCAFYIANAAGTELRHIVGMPHDYAECVDNFKISADSLACGLAVYTGKPIITPDISQEPRWKSWQWLTERFHYRACWSFPIETTEKKIIGTFAMYFRAPRDATATDYESAAFVTQAAAIIISQKQDVEERTRVEAALRKSEVQFRTLVDQATVGVAEVAPDRRIIFVNRKFCEIANRSEKKLLSMFVEELSYPDETPVCLRLVKKVFKTGEAVVAEKRYCRPDRKEIWVTESVSPNVTAQKKAERLIIVAIDVTARRTAESALRQTSKQLEISNQSLETKVRQRTAELDTTNQQLRGEIAERERAELARQILLRQLTTAEEEQRRRISRELHDEIGQHLAALTIGLKSLEAGKPNGKFALKELRRIAERVGREVHDVALELRPTALDDLGLVRALANYVEQWSKKTRIKTDFHTVRLNKRRLPAPIETTFYRITQEALTNVLKHAYARNVSVLLERHKDMVSLIIEDDGKGFSSSVIRKKTGRKKLGLRGMKERATLLNGELTVESNRLKGTTIFVRIPLPQKTRKKPKK